MNPVIEQPKLGRFLTIAPRAPRFDQGQPREILAEEPFHNGLCRERKRAERSGEGFLLMLICPLTDAAANLWQTTLREVVCVLAEATRETDIAGWYEQGAVLGVIFTQINSIQVNKSALQNLINGKMCAALRTRIGADLADQLHISFHFFPEDWNELSQGPFADPKLYPDLLKKDGPKNVSLFIKRALDIAGSIAALTVLSPLFLIISLAIKVTSKGPIFFKQERIGLGGLRFTFLKFRSMECASNPAVHREYMKRFIAGEPASKQSDQGQDAIYKIREDARVTRVGKLLRRASLDELPQFINVLKGDMSLVGPRPPIPYELEWYQVWHRRRMLGIKPGITGLWQVNGRSRVKFDDMVRLDIRYANKWSVALDMKILVQTPRAVLLGEGAY